MGTIDFHAHLVTPAFRAGLAELGIDPIRDDGFPLPEWDPKDHLAFMDEAGIDRAVLTVPAPHIHAGDDAASLHVAQRVNDETAAVCAARPDRFSFAAAVPLPFVDGAISEAGRALDELGAVGVKLATNSNGAYLGDPAFDPFLAELDQRGALAIIHPCRARQSPSDCVTGHVAALFEYPADTTRAVLNMVAHRVMTRFPRIRFVVPHCGSFLPYMLQRFDSVSGILAGLGMAQRVDIRNEVKGLWFDMAGDPEPVQLDMLRAVAPDDHIVYGSDYPHSPAAAVIRKKRSLFAEERFSPVTRGGGGEALLG